VKTDSAATRIDSKLGGSISQRISVAIAALLILLSVINLERVRSGLMITEMRVGETPVTRYQLPNVSGPLVVVAHGFAGSRQLMQSYSLDLAQSGYVVLAFDFEGHGRNPVPMSGDVTRVDGTTALLAAETQQVLEAGRKLPETVGGSALLGHSMATDIIVRAAQAEADAGREVDAVVAISMFSEAVTAQFPQRLLVISGEWEGALRAAALDALRLVMPSAQEGQTVQVGEVERRVVVAPYVEHVGVLFSTPAINEAREWLDGTFGRVSHGVDRPRGLWILILLTSIVMVFRAVVPWLPKRPLIANPPPISVGRFFLATLVPAIGVPLFATAVFHEFLPVLVADYLLIHLALYGAVQWLLLGASRDVFKPIMPLAIVALVIWGVVFFGFALDRYAASFLPTAERLLIIAVLSLGTVPFLLADSLVTEAGRAKWWRRITARVIFIASLVVAAVLDPERLTFVVIVLPVLLLFFCVHGLMGRWVAQRCGPAPAGIALGVCLAWALGVSFPLFAGG
jgi:hypothetical protein